MKTSTTIKCLSLIAIVLWSCGKKDTSLLDALPVETVVNPETKILLKDNQVLYAELESGNVIRGISLKNTFQTSDLFKSFTYQSYTLPQGSYPYFDKNYVATISNVQAPATVNYSTDYGISWKSVTPDVHGSTTSGYAGLIIGIKFLSSNTMLLLTGTNQSFWSLDYPPTNCWIFRANLQTGKGDSLACIKGYFPISMQFNSSSTGWMLLSKGNIAYISKTTNGGANWSTPVMVASPYEPLNLAVGTNTVFLYNKNGGGYFSTDGGTTWKKSKANDRFSEVTVIDDKTVYATTEAGFYKSNDSGDSWTAISLYSYGKLSFINEKQGIRYNTESMYITQDGGLSWKTLLYRFPYIIQ